MTTYREGARVSYVGDGSDGRVLGERGQILSITGRCGHVKWADTSITLVALDDVLPVASTTGAVRAAPAPVRDDLDDSLDVGPVPHLGMRGVYETEGGVGVLNALASSGQLSSFGAIAEEARTFVEQQIRQDPSFCQVTAQLDPDEADELIALASHVLIRDAFGQVTDGD